MTSGLKSLRAISSVEATRITPRHPQSSESTEVLIMNAHESTCHPGDGAKVLNRLPYLAEPLLRFDLQEELQEL
jgi:hypothetical protein